VAAVVVARTGLAVVGRSSGTLDVDVVRLPMSTLKFRTAHAAPVVCAAAATHVTVRLSTTAASMRVPSPKMHAGEPKEDVKPSPETVTTVPPAASTTAGMIEPTPKMFSERTVTPESVVTTSCSSRRSANRRSPVHRSIITPIRERLNTPVRPMSATRHL